MPSIDERIVSMAFENAKFEAGVATTMATLTKLDTAVKNVGSTGGGLGNLETQANKVTLNAPMSALDKLKAKLGMAGQGAAQGMGDIDRAGNKVTLEGPTRALDKVQGKMDQLNAGSTFTDIERASDQVQLGGLTRALENVSGKFTMLQGVATVALGNIASQAAMKGANFAKSFAFGPLTDGMKEYQTNLGSIQTILSNTQGQQVSGLDATNKYLGELNEYSDKTIYNFSEMAKNIGTFTAAGVDLPKSTEAIKGIANLAALSGSNSQQASTAMYQLSQAISAGRVGLQDWNSVVNAGMGGAVFQKSLMRTAENMGAIEKGAFKIDKATGKATINGESFRNSIMAKPGEESWLSSEVLTNTLSQLTGDMTDAELAAQGFSAEQIKAIQSQAKMAQDAATQVKTLPQVFDVARETIGSGWAKTFQLIFGDFEQSKKLFTGLSNFINGWINGVSDARNKLLEGWNKLGGRNKLIEGIKDLFINVRGWILPIRDAFQEIFPPATAQTLFNLTKMFADFAASLNTTDSFAENIRRTFAGVFAVLHIGWSVVKGIGGVIFDLIGVLAKATGGAGGGGGILGFTAGIGDFLVGLDKAITQGGALTGFFEGLSSVLQAPVRLLVRLSQAFTDLFSPDDNILLTERNSELQRFGEVLTPAERLVNNLKNGWNKLVEAFNNAKSALEPWFSMFVEKVSSIGQILSDAFSNLSFDTALAGIQTGLVGGIFLMIKKAFGGGGGIMDSITGTLDAVTDVLGGMSGQLEAMQKNLQAKTLLAIAAAVIALAGGIYILSTIDGDDLAKAMTATAVGLAQLMGALKLMMGGLGKFGALQLPVIAAGLIGVAIAVTILAGAMKLMSGLSWEDIAQGLVGVAGALVAVGVGMKLMGPASLVQGPALMAIGIALNLIALAVRQFGEMDWKEMGRGLLGVSLSLLAIGAATTLMGPSILLIGPGLIAVAIAMGSLAGAIAAFGSLKPETLVQGILGMAGALVALGIAIVAIPPTAALSGAGLIVMAAGLATLAGALGVMGSLPIPVLIKGIVAMGGALVVLAAGLILMTGTLPASAALLAAAGAFLILAPAIAIMGNMKWSTLLKGLGAMAAIMGTLAIVGALAAGPIALLGGALIALGLGMAAISGAVYILAKGFALLGEHGAKGVTIMVTALTAFIAILPKIVIDFVKGLVEIIAAVAELAPKVVAALSTILDSLLDVVIQSAPKMAIAIGVLVLSIIQVLTENVPRILAAGFELLRALLSGIDQNLGSVMTSVINIITKFLTGLAERAPDLVGAGAKLLIAVLRGIAQKVGDVVRAAFNMVTKFLAEVTKNIPKVVAMGARLITSFLRAVTGQIGKVIRTGVDMIIALMDGIERAIPRLITKGLSVARRFLNALANGLAELANIGFKAIIKFLNGLERAIRANFNALWNAGAGVADAIVDGMTGQFGKVGPVLRSAITSVFSLLPAWAKKILGISSPSRVFMGIGKDTMMGMAKGIKDGGKGVKDSMDDTAGDVVNSGKAMFGAISLGMPSWLMIEPVITPKLDLANVRREAKKLPGLMVSKEDIAAEISWRQAAQLARETGEYDPDNKAMFGGGGGVGSSFVFNQNNYSPKALSDVEIYRRTKNQLSQTRLLVGAPNMAPGGTAKWG